MKKRLHNILFILMLCIFSHSNVASQFNAKDFNLKLKGEIESKFNEASNIIYNPMNIPLADSIYNHGVANRDTSEMIAGLMLQAFPLTILNEMDKVKDVTDEIRSYTYSQEYKFAYFVAFQLQIRALIAQKNYIGSMTQARQMSRDAIALNYNIGINMSYYSMGLVLLLRENPRLAVTYFRQSEELSTKLSLPAKMTWPIYIEMTRAYALTEDYRSSFKYAKKAEETAIECGDIFIATRAKAISYVTLHQSLPAEQYIKEIDKVFQDTMLSKAFGPDELLIIKSQYELRKNNIAKAIAIADSISAETEAMINKESIYQYIGDTVNAYKCRLRRDMLKDSLQTIIQTEDIAALDGEMNNASLRILAQELNNEKRTTIQICAVIMILLLLGTYIYISIHRRKTLKIERDQLEKEVNKQTTELQELVNVINQKNSDMTDSIKYAQKIQKAILPDLDKYVGDGINGAFAFFKPYNIVSGDFYWANKVNDKVMIACSDCTGHGVPGAFMSMIGSTLLNDITSRNTDLKASEVLQELDEKMLTVLGQNSDEILSDGMDLALIIYDTKTHRISFSSARRPVYIVHDEELYDYKGIKRSIGDRDEMSRKLKFIDYSMEISKGDTIYLFTDGIADQFGGQESYGENGKRLSKAGVRKILMDIHKLDMNEQKNAFENIFMKWQGTCTQTDDIALIGIRF